jgi:hypothetical protein
MEGKRFIGYFKIVSTLPNGKLSIAMRKINEPVPVDIFCLLI